MDVQLVLMGNWWWIQMELKWYDEYLSDIYPETAWEKLLPTLRNGVCFLQQARSDGTGKQSTSCFPMLGYRNFAVLVWDFNSGYSVQSYGLAPAC